MARKIRIIYPQKEPTFSEKLEQRARKLIENLQERGWGGITLSIFEREIALTLDHMDRTRQLHDDLRRGLLRIECYVDTELMQLDWPRGQYGDEHSRKRERLTDKLGRIEEERRKLTVTLEDKLQPLQIRLLSLLNKRRQIKGKHGR